MHAAWDAPVLYVMWMFKYLAFQPSICSALGWAIAMNVVSLELNVSVGNVQERWNKMTNGKGNEKGR